MLSARTIIAGWMCCLPAVMANATHAQGAELGDLRVGLSRAVVTPTEPIRMAGYASRSKPSEGVLTELNAKAMAVEDASGHRGLLLTVDVIGFNARFAKSVCDQIREKTGLERYQIWLAPSHTHTGPVIGDISSSRYGWPEAEVEVIQRYGTRLIGVLTELAEAALADLKPAKLAWSVGVADFVMNRREATERGIRLGFNPRGYVDRSVPVLRIDSPGGELRAVIFGCACHNTTLTGQHYVLSGDYAGFAQQYIEQQYPGTQAMFVIGCAGSANPHPRGTVEAARQHGESLGIEVCRVASGQLQPVRGPLNTELKSVALPLRPVPPRDELERMAAGPRYIAFNARWMIEMLDRGESPPSEYTAPFAVWQWGEDLTMVALPGEVVNEYVPLIEHALGPRKLWISAYANDCFGYLPTARILAEGGYETRCLYESPGFFLPEVQDVVVMQLRELAEQAGRSLPKTPQQQHPW